MPVCDKLNKEVADYSAVLLLRAERSLYCWLWGKQKPKKKKLLTDGEQSISDKTVAASFSSPQHHVV